MSDITDHFSQVCLLSSSKEFHGVKSKKARDFSSFSVDQLKTAISTINWIDIIGNFGNDVNRAFSTFYKKLNKIVNKFAPIRVLHVICNTLNKLCSKLAYRACYFAIKVTYLSRACYQHGGSGP